MHLTTASRNAEIDRSPHSHPVRTAVRFPLRLEIQVETDDGWVEAVTENVSANGLLFSGRKLPVVGSRVSFTMSMPASLMGTEADVLIFCSGRIVRHQKDGSDMKAAAVIDEYFLKA